MWSASSSSSSSATGTFAQGVACNWRYDSLLRQFILLQSIKTKTWNTSFFPVSEDVKNCLANTEKDPHALRLTFRLTLWGLWDMAACPLHPARRHLGAGCRTESAPIPWDLVPWDLPWLLLLHRLHRPCWQPWKTNHDFPSCTATNLCNLWVPWQEPHAKEWPGKSKIKLTKGCSSKKGANSGHSQRFLIQKKLLFPLIRALSPRIIQKHCCSPWLGLLVPEGQRGIQI